MLQTKIVWFLWACLVFSLQVVWANPHLFLLNTNQRVTLFSSPSFFSLLHQVTIIYYIGIICHLLSLICFHCYSTLATSQPDLGCSTLRIPGRCREGRDCGWEVSKKILLSASHHSMGVRQCWSLVLIQKSAFFTKIYRSPNIFIILLWIILTPVFSTHFDLFFETERQSKSIIAVIWRDKEDMQSALFLIPAPIQRAGSDPEEKMPESVGTVQTDKPGIKQSCTCVLCKSIWHLQERDQGHQFVPMQSDS